MSEHGVAVATGDLPVHTLRTEQGEAKLIGHCFATPELFESAARLALQRADITLLENLPGSYTTVMSSTEGCEVSTDLAGRYLPYWNTERPARLDFEYGPSFGDVLDIDYLALTSILLAHEAVPGRTAFRSTSRLEGGQRARFTQHGLASVSDVIVPIDPTITSEEAAYNLRFALTGGMQYRAATGKKITTCLSGGYDSSCGAAVANSILLDGLDAFIRYWKGIPTGDLYYAREVANAHPGIRLHELPGSTDSLPLSHMRYPVKGSVRPGSWTSRRSMFEHYYTAIAQYGSNIHIGGDGGDSILSPASNYITDIVRQGELDHARHIAQVRGRMLGLDPEMVYRKALYDSTRTFTDDLRDLAEMLHSNHTPPPRSQKRLSPFSLLSLAEHHIPMLTTNMRRSLCTYVEDLATEQAGKALGTESTHDYYTTLADLRTVGGGKATLQQIASTYGIELHTPYTDRQVIEACLTVPPKERVSVSQYKFLLQQAFPDMLPETVRTRNSRGNFFGPLYKGLRHNKDRILVLLSKDCRTADLGIIEPQRVIQEVETLDTGQPGMIVGIEQIMALEHWLRCMDGEPYDT